MNEQALFLNDWQTGSIETLKSRFAITDADLRGIEILLASYTRELCRGSAFILYRKDGVLYEVNAGHDSVDDMRGQWEPEDTFVEALRYRLEKGRLGEGAHGVNLFANELWFLLLELERGIPRVS